jgi:hypothetical protein
MCRPSLSKFGPKATSINSKICRASYKIFVGRAPERVLLAKTGMAIIRPFYQT